MRRQRYMVKEPEFGCLDDLAVTGTSMKLKNESVNDMIDIINQNCIFPDKQVKKGQNSKK